MRWKLVVPVSIIAALLALTLWSAVAILFFGSAWAMARNDWRLAGSLLIPIALAAFSGIFAYRHTARRRKMQAFLTIVLTCVLSATFYLAASQAFPEKLLIPLTSEVRHAR